MIERRALSCSAGFLPLAAALLTACAPDAGAPASTATVDSTGAPIVEYTHVPDLLPTVARLDPEALVIGQRDGPLAYTFGRIAAVALLPDGGVAVADSRAREVRLFGAGGNHVATLGGQGEGPGEFRSLSGLAGVAGDTVWAWDAQAQRLTGFLSDGTVVAEATREGEFVGRILRLDRLADGTFVGRSAWRLPGASANRQVDWHVARDTVVLRHLDAGLALLDTVVVLPGREYLLAENTAAAAGTFSTSRAERPRPFTRSLYYDVTPGGVVTGVSDAFAWVHRGADGAVRRTVRAPALDRPITPEHVEALKARYRAGPGGDEARVETLFGDFPLPDTLPAFEALHVDDRGRVWLSRFRLHDEGPTRWVVFDPAGELLGRAETPWPFEVHHIGQGHVIGVRWDEFDVSYVARYALEELIQGAAVPRPLD
ncbi:MAG: hypothetical protein WEB88_16065 [Gemmatimonadota bacterium]